MTPPGFGRYGTVLAVPHVLPLTLAGIAARLPVGMLGLALILFLRDEDFSYAVAGGASAASALGTAIGNPALSRLIDRLGVPRVTIPAAATLATCLVAVVIAAEAGASPAVVISLSAAAGLALPPASSIIRSLYTELVTPDQRPTAFALDAVVVELAFVAGPLLVALLAATTSADAAVLVAAALAVAGTLAIVAQPPARGVPTPTDGGHGLLGPLRSGPLRIVLLASVPLGVCIGAMEVALPAFAETHDSRESAGILLAIWSLGSGAAGLLYGARPPRGALARTWLAWVVIAPVGYLFPLAGGELWTMALLVLPAGIVIAPTLTAGSQLVGSIAPDGTVTEAYAWSISALVVGLAIGQTTAGGLVDAHGWRSAMAVGVAVGVLGGIVAVGGRHRVAAAEIRR